MSGVGWYLVWFIPALFVGGFGIFGLWLMLLDWLYER